jgi:AraC-like DNA-binding protein
MASTRKADGLTASMVCAAKLFGYGVACGLPPSKMLEAAGVCAEDLAQPEKRMPVRDVLSLWELLIRELSDRSIPIRIAQGTRIEDHEIMGLAILTSADGRNALERAVRYGRLFTEAGTWRTQTAGRSVTVRWLSAVTGSLGAEASAECAVGEFVHALRLFARERLRIERAFFAHPPPKDHAPFGAFFGCDVEYDAKGTGFCFDAGALDVVPPAANPALSAFVLEHAERLLAELARTDSLEGRVRAAIALELPGGSVALPAVARRYGVSERTLRRQLLAGGVSFRTLVDAVRYERAQELLAREELSLKEVAFSLGFSEPSAFGRAYKRWTGASPRKGALDRLPMARDEEARGSRQGATSPR